MWLALEREIMNPAIANSESQVGMVEKERKEKERDFRYRVAMPPPRSTWDSTYHSARLKISLSAGGEGEKLQSNVGIMVRELSKVA